MKIISKKNSASRYNTCGVCFVFSCVDKHDGYYIYKILEFSIDFLSFSKVPTFVGNMYKAVERGCCNMDENTGTL